MTEIGKDLLEALDADGWIDGEYRYAHDTLGIDLWTANGFGHFRIYGIQGMFMREEAFAKLLNVFDRRVLWARIKEKRIEGAISKEKLFELEVHNRIKLAKIKVGL
jgi:hypothetical protein